MKRYGWQGICFILLLLLASQGFSRAETPSHVPEGVAMQEAFAPGFGDTLGIFKKTVGQVVLIHATDTLGYWAETDLPLYMKDTVITPEEGLALLQFLDDSTISVASDSELVINHFIFDPDKFDRSTFLNMKTGRSRFWVKKLEGFTRSEFKVKTKTMIAGVRGSDFVIVITPKGTEVFTLDDTVLELVSLSDPDKVIILHSYEKVQITGGEPVSAIEKLSPAEVARLKSELPMPFDSNVMDAAGRIESEKTVSPAREDAKQQPAEEILQAEGAGSVQEQIARLLDAGPATVILIPEEDLVPPDPPVEGAGDEPPTDFIGFETGQVPGGVEGMTDMQGEIVEEAAQEIITSDIILVDLPGPPVTPP